MLMCAGRMIVKRGFTAEFFRMTGFDVHLKSAFFVLIIVAQLMSHLLVRLDGTIVVLLY